MSNCDSCSDSSCSVKQPGAVNDEQAQIRQNLAIRMCGIKHKVMVMSGKGGVATAVVASWND